MLNVVSKYAQVGFAFLEKGLAHASFLGRAVSWGIFYGALYLLVQKIVQMLLPFFNKKNLPSTPPPQLTEGKVQEKVQEKEGEKDEVTTPGAPEGETIPSTPTTDTTTPTPAKESEKEKEKTEADKTESQKKTWGFWPFN